MWSTCSVVHMCREGPACPQVCTGRVVKSHGQFRGRETGASSLIANGGVWPGAVRTAGRVRRLGRLIALSCFASSHLRCLALAASIPDAYAPCRALRAVACLLGDGCTIPRRAALCTPLKTPDRAAALTGQCAGALAGVRAGGVLRGRVLHSQNGQPCLSKKGQAGAGPGPVGVAMGGSGAWADAAPRCGYMGWPPYPDSRAGQLTRNRRAQN